MLKTMKEATKENKNDIADGHEMYSIWFGYDVIHFHPCCGAAKLVLHNKVNHPMNVKLHWDCVLQNTSRSIYY